VALTRVRDLDAVVAGFTGWLAHEREAPVAVTAVDRPTDGWSSETVLVRAELDGSAEGFALRLPPLGEGIFPSYDLGLQARAQAAAAAAGVPTAVPAHLVEDPGWLDTPFLVMPLVEGHVPGEVPALDPWAHQQQGLHQQVADLLADLHGADPSGLDLPCRTVAEELAWWDDYLRWSGTAQRVPAVAVALERCTATAPTDEPRPALLWGDVRLGNVVFADDATPAAVLDWEMATIGAPEHDLGWWWALESLQDDLVGGRHHAFAPLDQLRARYEARAGRGLRDLPWYEAFALLRSTAVLTRIGLLQVDAGLTPRMDLATNPVVERLTRRVDALG
jgi:aminoglycoside phosphotransferase (APT) family kinase protein